MTDEEKKALRNLENLSEFGLSTSLNQADLDKMKIVLNLVEKQGKVIDEMTEHIVSSAIVDDMVCMYIDCTKEECHEDTARKCTKQYFYRKVEKDG